MAKVTRLTLDRGGGLEHRRLQLHETSDDAEDPLETVGQNLRKARQRKGADLAQVAAVLKIRRDHLDAIEESNFELLPGRTYAIGFVRAYAEYLGLDHQECVGRLKQEIAGRADSKGAPLNFSPRERKLPQGSFVFVVLLLIALIYGIYYLVMAAGNVTSQPVMPVPERLAEQAGLNDQPSGRTAQGPEALQPGRSAAGLPAPSDTDIASAPPIVSSIPPSSAPPAANVNRAESTMSGVDAGSLPSGRLMGAQNRDSRIALRVHRPIFVEVIGPGNRVFLRRPLTPGDVYQAPNLVGLKLSTPDSGAIEIILDGDSQGFAGKDGAVAEGLSLDPQDVVDRVGRG